ncbi:MAG: VOC family protein [Acidimicrobiia bacterium]|nr:VOC family protein [Acidimicrobiia bacterium]
MDYAEYRQKYFVNPPPEPRFRFAGLHGLALFYEDYEQAIDFYTSVLGPPAYVEGEGTKSWPIGDTWLTLLHGKDGNPTGVEVPFVTATPAEADRLQQAFIAAGGTGSEPIDTLMGEPIRYCPVTDPLGVELLVYCPLG